jgi:hypothetical protein
MSAWELYFLTRLSNINAFCCIVSIALGIGLFVCIIEASLSNGTARLLLKKIIVAFVVFGVLALAIPTTKEYLIIRGVSAVTQNERVVQNTGKIINGVEAFIDEKMNLLKEAD